MSFPTTLPDEIHLFNNSSGGSNHESDDAADATVSPGAAFVLGVADGFSIQCIWSGLGGTINGTLVFETSNDPACATTPTTAKWNIKSGNSLVLSGAAGTGELSFSGSGFLNEKYNRVRYTAGTTTGGTLNVYGYAVGRP